MAEAKFDKDVINYKIGVSVLRDSAISDLAMAAEDLREVRVNRKGQPLTKDELGYLKNGVTQVVTLHMSLYEAQRWSKTTKADREKIFQAVYNAVLEPIYKSPIDIGEFVAATIINTVEAEAEKYMPRQ